MMNLIPSNLTTHGAWTYPTQQEWYDRDLVTLLYTRVSLLALYGSIKCSIAEPKFATLLYWTEKKMKRLAYR